MIKLAYDQRFHWSETFAFARARAAAAPRESRRVLFVVLTLMFFVPLALSGLAEDAADYGALLLFAVGGATLIAFVFVPLSSMLPQNVFVASDRFGEGPQSIPFADVEHAEVGMTEIKGRAFPTLTFKTRAGKTYLYGLGRTVDAGELAEFLKQAGVREPRD